MNLNSDVRCMDSRMIPKEAKDYLDDGDYNQAIYYCKGEDAGPRLDQAILEASMIKNIIPDYIWQENHTYVAVIRFFTNNGC